MANEARAWLLNRAYDVHSRFGEDGIIAAALERLSARNRCCVEFGAWDGRFTRNTCRHVEAEGWSAGYIEGDLAKLGVPERDSRERADVIPPCRCAGWEGGDRLGRILGGAPIPRDFDVVSMDTVGNDWHVWAATVAYRPKIIVVELNPPMPNELDCVQPADFDANVGCSPRALDPLDKQEGDELAWVTRRVRRRRVLPAVWNSGQPGRGAPHASPPGDPRPFGL